jgi:hypothetical protein
MPARATKTDGFSHVENVEERRPVPPAARDASAKWLSRRESSEICALREEPASRTVPCISVTVAKGHSKREVACSGQARGSSRSGSERSQCRYRMQTTLKEKTACRLP